MDINYYRQFEPIDGKWYITKKIGKGSFGTVFEIERRDYANMKSALKVITIPSSPSDLKSFRNDNFDMDDESIKKYFYSFVDEFMQEFQLMSTLKGNNNVVAIEDYDVKAHRDDIGWDIFIRMELLTPLNEYFTKHRLDSDTVIKIGIDMCKALEGCKKHNIIHRDIKPSNIFVSETGDFKLGDFGVARTMEKTTGELSKKGTYIYMAPEVFKSENYGASADIYSLGIVMYKLLNNNLEPFRTEKTPTDLERSMAMRMQNAKMPPPVNADKRLADIVLKACAYDPAQRYRDPAQLRRDLEKLVSSDAVTTGTASATAGVNFYDGMSGQPDSLNPSYRTDEKYMKTDADTIRKPLKSTAYNPIPAPRNTGVPGYNSSLHNTNDYAGYQPGYNQGNAAGHSDYGTDSDSSRGKSGKAIWVVVLVTLIIALVLYGVAFGIYAYNKSNSGHSASDEVVTVSAANAELEGLIAGNSPGDIEFVTAQSDEYTVSLDSCYYYDKSSDDYIDMAESDIFRFGVTYYIRFKFEPEDGYAFDASTAFTLNSAETTAYGTDEEGISSIREISMKAIGDDEYIQKSAEHDWNESSRVRLGNWEVPFKKFDTPIEDCRSFTLHFSISNVVEGNPYGPWLVYLRNERGNWNQVYRFVQPKTTEVTEWEVSSAYTFDTFDAIALVRDSGSSSEHSFGFYTTDFVIKK